MQQSALPLNATVLLERTNGRKVPVADGSQHLQRTRSSQIQGFNEFYQRETTSCHLEPYCSSLSSSRYSAVLADSGAARFMGLAIMAVAALASCLLLY